MEVQVPQSHLNFRVYYTPSKVRDATLVVCHHGAGYSGLSFACFASEVSQMSNGELGVLVYDARRHGMFNCSGMFVLLNNIGSLIL